MIGHAGASRRKCADCGRPANGYVLTAEGKKVHRCDDHHRKAWEVRKAKETGGAK